VFDDVPTRDDAALLLLQFSKVERDSLLDVPDALDKTWRFHSSDAFTAHTSRHEIMAYLRRMAANPGEVFNAVLESIERRRRAEDATVSHLRIEPRWPRLPSCGAIMQAVTG